MTANQSAAQKSLQEKLDLIAALGPLATAGNETAKAQLRQTTLALIPESARGVAHSLQTILEVFTQLGATSPDDFSKLADEELTGTFTYVTTVAQRLADLDAEMNKINFPN
ncbi:hypothetical protein ACQEU6_27960 [Spirillospora sp. CA-108201]